MKRILTQKQFDAGYWVRYSDGQQLHYFYEDFRKLKDGTFEVSEPEYSDKCYVYNAADIVED